MKEKTISEINEIYDLKLDEIINAIKKYNVKKALIQMPEGLKPYSLAVGSFIEEKTGCECFIWMGSCFGACDIPLEVEKLGIELIIQFGHSKWNYKRKDIKIIE